MPGPVVLHFSYASESAAVEALSTEELVSHCAIYGEDPDGEDGIFCVRYIQGFIDGAVATDERVTYNVAAEYDREETFTHLARKAGLPSNAWREGTRFWVFKAQVFGEKEE